MQAHAFGSMVRWDVKDVASPWYSPLQSEQAKRLNRGKAVASSAPEVPW